jgi:beta-glucanase (GH16 family)
MRHPFLIVFLVFCGFTGCAQKNSTIDDPSTSKNWQLVWNEDFNYSDAQLDSEWFSQNGPNTHILCSRWRDNAVVENGILHLNNRKENRGGQEWTSASIWTKKQFQYGRFECRYKYAAAIGTNNSFWLMTTGIVPATGKKFEIDINEGHYPVEINTNLHNWSDVTTDPITGKSQHPSDHKSLDFSSVPDANLSKDFHVYGLEWTKDSLIYYFDGKVIRRMRNDFCHSPVPVYLSEAIISWAGVVTDVINGTSMDVDWVKVYKQK